MEKKIFLVRSGDHYAEQITDNPGLSEIGVQQTKVLAEKIGKTFPEGTQILICTAPTRRCKEGAKIFQETLGLKQQHVEFVEKLGTKNHLDCDVVWLQNFMEEKEVDVLIIITHIHYTRKYPLYLGFPERCRIDPGEALMIEDGYIYEIGR
jgi:broad specificity phosphatase PhoE